MALRGNRKNENLFSLGEKEETVISRHDLGASPRFSISGLETLCTILNGQSRLLCQVGCPFLGQNKSKYEIHLLHSPLPPTSHQILATVRWGTSLIFTDQSCSKKKKSLTPQLKFYKLLQLLLNSVFACFLSDLGVKFLTSFGMAREKTPGVAFNPMGLHSCYSEYSLWTSYMNITWEPTRNAVSQAPHSY